RCMAGEAGSRGVPAGRAGNVDRQDARLPRPQFHRRRPDARASGCAAAVRVERHVMHGLSFDIAHMLAGLLVLVSFLMLYQDRLYALLHVLALHALVLAASVGWQAYIQNAPHLYITAAIALGFKAIIVPAALHRMVFRLGIHREIENVVSVGLTMLGGMALVALSLEVMLPVTSQADPVAREDIALALSVVLIGLLMMVTRRN